MRVATTLSCCLCLNSNDDWWNTNEQWTPMKYRWNSAKFDRTRQQTFCCCGIYNPFTLCMVTNATSRGTTWHKFHSKFKMPSSELLRRFRWWSHAMPQDNAEKIKHVSITLVSPRAVWMHLWAFIGVSSMAFRYYTYNNVQNAIQWTFTSFCLMVTCSQKSPKYRQKKSGNPTLVILVCKHHIFH